MTPKILAVASGKGGVGKTFVAANLAKVISKDSKQRVLLIDADFSLSNADILLGVNAEFTIDDFLFFDVPLKQVIVNVSPGFDLLPSSSGKNEKRDLTLEERRKLTYSLEDISCSYDLILIDCAPGVARDTLQICAISHKTILCVTPEPTSITDAYAFIKLMKENYKEERFDVLLNMVHSEAEAFSVFRRLMSVTSDFLGVSLNLLGFIPLDRKIQASIQARQLLVDRMKFGSSVKSIKDVAKSLLQSGNESRIWNGGYKALWPLFLSGRQT